MVVAQRGTEFNPYDGDYTLDRHYYRSSQFVHHISQSNVVPGAPFIKSMHIRCNSSQPISDGDFACVGQRIEGHNFRKLMNQRSTFSFWVKSTKRGVMCVAFRNKCYDISRVCEVEIHQPNIWERKFVGVSFDAAGEWDFTNGIGVDISIILAAGTDHTTSKTDMWLSGDYLASPRQSNFCEVSDDIYITGLQLEIGNSMSPFECVPMEVMLSLCERYFEKSYDVGIKPGLPAEGGMWCHAFPESPGEAYTTVGFTTYKRTTPEVTLFDSGGNAGRITQIGPTASIDGRTTNVGMKSFVFGTDDPSPKSGILAHWVSDAEL
jgi:hypothetical protein